MSLSQLVCGLFGHNHLTQHEPGRKFLRCVDCGHETPGFIIRKSLPTRIAHGRIPEYSGYRVSPIFRDDLRAKARIVSIG